MNAARRKELNKLIDQLEDIKSQLGELQQEEQDAYDNLPESLQDSERGERIQEAAENMEYAATSIDEVIDYINNAIEA